MRWKEREKARSMTRRSAKSSFFFFSSRVLSLKISEQVASFSSDEPLNDDVQQTWQRPLRRRGNRS